MQEDLPRLIGAQDAFTIFVRKDEIKAKVATYVNQDAGCKNDAIKHGTWSAWLAQEFGADTANLVTNAHKGSNKMEKDFAFNSTMDQHNNAYGRFVFAGFQAVHPTQHLSVDEWIPKIAEHYPTGDLWIWWPKTKESNQSEGILHRSDDKKIK